jgi:hypothetical protein
MSENPVGGPPVENPDEPTERGVSLRVFGIVAASLLVILLLVFLATR